MTIGTGNVAGSSCNSTPRALGPPVEVPMARISMGADAGAADRPPNTPDGVRGANEPDDVRAPNDPDGVLNTADGVRAPNDPDGVAVVETDCVGESV